MAVGVPVTSGVADGIDSVSDDLGCVVYDPVLLDVHRVSGTELLAKLPDVLIASAVELSLSDVPSSAELQDNQLVMSSATLVCDANPVVSLVAMDPVLFPAPDDDQPTSVLSVRASDELFPDGVLV